VTPFLESEQIVLRRFDYADIPTWYQWFNDADVTNFMNKGFFPNTEAAQTEFFEAIAKSRSDVLLAIVSKASQELVGVIGVHNIDWIHRHGDVSIVVGNRQYWSKGIAGEAIAAVCEHAFVKLNLHKLTAGLWEPNTACRRAFERNGFVAEGVMREQFFFKGQYVDEVRLGLVQTDWQAKSDVRPPS
jgi:RimJ/RimL family protein N-acetyltransferase